MREAKQDHSHQAVPSDTALRVKALESLLIEKGLVDPAALDAIVDMYETRVGPRNGARVVAGAGSAPGKASTWGRWRTRRWSTIWSSARCAPVIRGLCWACRQYGTNRRP